MPPAFLRIINLPSPCDRGGGAWRPCASKFQAEKQRAGDGRVVVRGNPAKAHPLIEPDRRLQFGQRIQLHLAIADAAGNLQDGIGQGLAQAQTPRLRYHIKPLHFADTVFQRAQAHTAQRRAVFAPRQQQLALRRGIFSRHRRHFLLEFLIGEIHAQKIGIGVEQGDGGFQIVRRAHLRDVKARAHAALIACSRSSQISSASSRPTERRNRPEVTPSSARASGVSLEWVVVSGWVIRLLASPRLLEMSIRESAFERLNAAFLPPSISKATMPPPASIWARARLCWGWSARKG